MSTERTISSFTSLTDLGASLRQEFHALIASSASGWFDAQPISHAASQTTQSLEKDLQDLQHLSDDLLVLEAWLTSGFFPMDLSTTLPQGTMLLSAMDDNMTAPAWRSSAAQSIVSRPLHAAPHPEATFTPTEVLAERGPTLLVKRDASELPQSPAIPQRHSRHETAEHFVARSQTPVFQAAPSGVALENEPAAPSELEAFTATIPHATLQPEIAPPIRTFRDLASRVRTAAIDEQALSAEDLSESFVAAVPELRAPLTRESEPLARTPVAFPQTSPVRSAASAESASLPTVPSFSGSDAAILTSENSPAQSPPEPVVLRTSRTSVALARLGVATSSDASSEQIDATLLVPQLDREVSFSQRLQPSTSLTVTKEDAVVFSTVGAGRSRLTGPTTTTPAQVRASTLEPSFAEAPHFHTAPPTTQSAAHSNRLSQGESPEAKESSAPLERLRLEDVDTILESLEREIEREYRRYYRD